MYKRAAKFSFFVLLTGLCCVLNCHAKQSNKYYFIGNDQVAVVANKQDPLSIEIAKYYQAQRKIPSKNIFYVDIKTNTQQLSVAEFSKIKQRLDKSMSKNIQAILLTWKAPYRVGCMSVSAAFALGYDRAYCGEGCEMTKEISYAFSDSSQPYRDYKIRPTMMLSAENLSQAKALIDRGVAAEGTMPSGTTYLVYNDDKQRNVRAVNYPDIVKKFRLFLKMSVQKSDGLAYRNDILFYFIGASRVKNLDTLTFRPGAIADHLTSVGGLPKSGQMSAWKWLDAGATGTYGTVFEPCNFPQKFPDIEQLIQHYLAGSTLIEAYWKSVKMPGQGNFMGDPLARPFF